MTGDEASHRATQQGSGGMPRGAHRLSFVTLPAVAAPSWWGRGSCADRAHCSCRTRVGVGVALAGVTGLLGAAFNSLRMWLWRLRASKTAHVLRMAEVLGLVLLCQVTGRRRRASPATAPYGGCEMARRRAHDRRRRCHSRRR